MQDEARFHETYLALVALNWQALERIDQLLCAGGDAPAMPAIELRLQCLRLELLQLDASAVRCAAMHKLSIDQHHLLQVMIDTVLEWLDFSATTPREVMRLRLAAAQDWLMDEATQGCHEDSGLDRLRC